MWKQLFGMGWVFAVISVAWFFLGSFLQERFQRSFREEEKELGSVTERNVVQHPPQLGDYVYSRFSPRLSKQADCGSKVEAKIQLDLKRVKRFWVSGYRLFFRGNYCLKSSFLRSISSAVAFPLPQTKKMVRDVHVLERGQGKKQQERVWFLKNRQMIIPFQDISNQSSKKRWIEIRYTVEANDSWVYSLSSLSGWLEKFSLQIQTDFDRVDFIDGSMSPTQKKKLSAGWLLSWKFSKGFSKQNVGIRTPKPIHSDRFVERITFFAPVGLFLLFLVFFVLSKVLEFRLSMLQLFFLGSSCFSLHILFAFSADVLPLESAFAVASIVSLLLILSYLSIPLGWKKAWILGIFPPFLYMVLFSGSFYWKGVSGLSISLLCLVTLFFLMQTTARMKWFENRKE